MDWRTLVKTLNVLVFPCGSEIGLELFRCLRYEVGIHLIGASSAEDHGRYVYKDYVGGIPYVDSSDLIGTLAELVKRRKVDAIFPTMDSVVSVLKQHETELGCKVISSEVETTDICLSKERTYKKLETVIQVPKTFQKVDEITQYPVFAKPDVGYGSRMVRLIASKADLDCFLCKAQGKMLICEYLPGTEYTVDCFTDRHSFLRFVGPRVRSRISNGISVHTSLIEDSRFNAMAQRINQNMTFRGAWFFQVKEKANGELVLLEVAARLGGSSSLQRGKGVNFALLSLADALDQDVDINVNTYSADMDRALDNKYKLDLEYDSVYVDYVDCLCVHGKVNADLIRYLYECISNGRRIVLVALKHEYSESVMRALRLSELFDECLLVEQYDELRSHVEKEKAIYIVNSYFERVERGQQLGIPVFSLDMVECLYE